MKIKYTDFETVNMQRTVEYTNQDHSILKTVKKLFIKLNNRRILIRLIVSGHNT